MLANLHLERIPVVPIQMDDDIAFALSRRSARAVRILMRPWLLYLTVFVSGMSTLAIELTPRACWAMCLAPATWSGPTSSA